MDSYVPGGDTSDPPLRRTRRDESRRRDHADTDRGSSQPNESNDTWISPEYRSSRIAAPARPDVSRQLPSRLTDDVYIPGQTFAKGPPSPRGRRARSPRRSRDRDHTSYLSGQLPPPISTFSSSSLPPSSSLSVLSLFARPPLSVQCGACPRSNRTDITIVIRYFPVFSYSP